MATPNDRPWLWVGMGVLTFVVVRTASNQLQQTSKHPKVETENVRPRMIDQRTEDALSLETLRRLVDSPNRDIRLATIKIIRDRAFSGPAYDILLQDVASPVEEIRARGLVALRSICYDFSQQRVYPYTTYDAVITALVNMMHAPWRFNGLPRPAQERNALEILGFLQAINLDYGIKAGVVRRWLAHFPFGRTDSERQENIMKLLRVPLTNLMAASTDRMAAILHQIRQSPQGEQELRAAGLLGKDEEVNQTEGDENAQVNSSSSPSRSHGSSEERRIRRRRREAMVVNDGARPLGRSDIIQRELSGLTDEG